MPRISRNVHQNDFYPEKAMKMTEITLLFSTIIFTLLGIVFPLIAQVETVPNNGAGYLQFVKVFVEVLVYPLWGLLIGWFLLFIAYVFQTGKRMFLIISNLASVTGLNLGIFILGFYSSTVAYGYNKLFLATLLGSIVYMLIFFWKIGIINYSAFRRRNL